MLFLIILASVSIWLALFIKKKLLSWHSIVSAYVLFVFIIDSLEVLFNLLLNKYKFPTHLLSDPILDNQLGIVFTDTLILPFAFIIFVHFALRNNHWKISVVFALVFILLEFIYLKSGYLQYINWTIIYSAIIYLVGFRISAYLSKPLASYNPPIPYPVRLFCFSYTILMWVGATLGLPILKLYQFKTGLFQNFMADDRFVDLYSGVALALICALSIPKLSSHLKPFGFAVITCIGISFALFSFSKGWLMYHHWNHFFTVLRYIIPFALIMLYDRWELSFQPEIA